MRGDIGALLMESRIMENKILFVKNINEGYNELLKKNLEKYEERWRYCKNKKLNWDANNFE